MKALMILGFLALTSNAQAQFVERFECSCKTSQNCNLTDVEVETDEFRPGTAEVDVFIAGVSALNALCDADKLPTQTGVASILNCQKDSLTINANTPWANTTVLGARFIKFNSEAKSFATAAFVLATEATSEKPTQQVLLCNPIME